MDPEARYRLPLFPLPVVLLPTAAMPLHIFEARYRRMVAWCLEHDKRFGLIYHDADVRGPFLMEEGRVGCVAEIQDFQPLPGGRSLLVARGIERFAIADGVESESPYYEALVTAYGDEPDRTGGLDLQRRSSLALFEAVLGTLEDRPERLPELDLDAELSFPLARAIEVEPAWKQDLLEDRRESHRLEKLDLVFRAALR